MHKFLISLSIILIIFLVSCTKSIPTPGVDEPGGSCSIDPQSTCAAPTKEMPTPGLTETVVQPALYGTWQGEYGQWSITLTVNEKTVDVYTSPFDGGVTTQMRYAITSLDWARDLITVVLTHDVVGGQELPVEDTPLYMKVWIDSDVLYYSIGAEPPETALLGPLSRQ